MSIYATKLLKLIQWILLQLKVESKSTFYTLQPLIGVTNTSFDQRSGLSFVNFLQTCF